jgi:hypothetical protein
MACRLKMPYLHFAIHENHGSTSLVNGYTESFCHILLKSQPHKDRLQVAAPVLYGQLHATGGTRGQEIGGLDMMIAAHVVAFSLTW